VTHPQKIAILVLHEIKEAGTRMGHYKHLPPSQRERIAIGVSNHRGIRELSREIGVHPSTASREIARNGGAGAYSCVSAQARRWAWASCHAPGKRPRWMGEVLGRKEYSGMDVFENRDWADVSGSESEALTTECNAELGTAHPLTGRIDRAIVRRLSQDDVLFMLRDGCCAVVHLTWSENNPDGWPRYSEFASLLDAKRYIDNKWEE
jgi:hypothetical protein